MTARWRLAGRVGMARRGVRLGRLSVRARLVLLTVALLAVGLASSNAVSLLDLRRPLVDRVDGQLRLTVGLVAQFEPLARAVSGSIPEVPRDELPAAPDGDGSELVSDVYFAYLSADGRVEVALRPSPRAGASGPRLPRLDVTAVAARGARPFEVPGRDGAGAWRVIVVPRTAAGSGGSVVAAASLSEVDATISRVATRFLVVGGLVLVGLAVAGWFAVGAGLRPLRRVEETATAISGGDLSQRVPDLAGPRTEVGRLSTALNGMLAQIEAGAAARAESEARMRRFVADVSHELRTPLFGIKGFTELYRMGGLPDRADVDRTMGRIERESARLSSLVEDLLLLARLDERAGGAALPLQLAPMDLRSLAADALHDLHALDPSRPVALTGAGDGPPTSAAVLGDEARLRQVVSNLVGNAVAHTPPGTAVRVGVGTVGAEAVLEVADEGPGMSEAEAAMVFERFYRVDDSRSRAAGGGAGLGLAIVRSLVAGHGGRVELRTAVGAGATFRVVFPSAADSA